MQTREWRFPDDWPTDEGVPKAQWGNGPWLTECDKKQWADPATGLPCLAVRNRFGSWCGYVGVTPPHPWYGKDSNNIEDEDDVDVHGGLTFAGACDPDPECREQGLCHMPDPGEPDEVWWVGFDCGHAFDLAPGMRALLTSLGTPFPSSPHEVYRDLVYVAGECARLAKQAARASRPGSPNRVGS